jgi:hypothetical protein
MPQSHYPKEDMIEQHYSEIRADIIALLHAARTTAARTINALMTAPTGRSGGALSSRKCGERNERITASNWSSVSLEI